MTRTPATGRDRIICARQRPIARALEDYKDRHGQD